MPFNRPTLSDLIARNRGDIETRLPGADSGLRHSVLDVLARMHGGAVSGVYGYLDFLARQLFPDTADGAFLARHASTWGIRRKAAVAATATATATGINGTAIAAGTEALRIDGQAYRVTAPATIADGTAALALEAVDAGPAADLTVGAVLTLSSAVPGVNASLTVTTLGTRGALEEDDASLLARLLDRIRTPPRGGSSNDYRAWALAQPGVTRAWVYPGWTGAGTVGVAFVMDQREDIIPQPEDLAAVQAALDDLRPVTAEVVVFAPTPAPVDIVLRIAPNTPAVQAAVTAELADFLARDAQPGGTIYRSRLSETISLAEGEFSHALELPEDDFTPPPGHIASLGTVTFI
ncbi:baseplate J/gp47 family protein [Porphyrobacter sp. YT40]|uniref:baseplate J/gp47 family protein n=1 Tax=Porphyrobacter sp. YT40 TaxID=2547601 RepID=UPI0011415324|nr:baseplate J/gp47 family protein [Porphyrobacter sp. YT40]QDH35860.1 baseplate J/gp47 family protein [Porphyrobacter sp. YT40]